ncbi:hypothetical protein sr16688 [Sporisorium reilianum SRZ2]|uniref:Uncharacterized protein n=1 Tax=Sporisorium reilianum (strain SRZ2) TaxID=999809 RepID=E6ZVM2_SPORE|nr:hypothetical protein sr16688 [Sporisorium reilianum SRZ2]
MEMQLENVIDLAEGQLASISARRDQFQAEGDAEKARMAASQKDVDTAPNEEAKRRGEKATTPAGSAQGKARRPNWHGTPTKCEHSKWAQIHNLQELREAPGAIVPLKAPLDDLLVVESDLKTSAGCIENELDTETFHVDVAGPDSTLSADECLRAFPFIFDYFKERDSVEAAPTFVLSFQRPLGDQGSA